MITSLKEGKKEKSNHEKKLLIFWIRKQNLFRCRLQTEYETKCSRMSVATESCVNLKKGINKKVLMVMAITGTPFVFPSLILLRHFSIKDSCKILSNSSSSSFLLLSSSSCARAESSIANRRSVSGLEVETELEGVVSLRSTKTPSDSDLWLCNRT